MVLQLIAVVLSGVLFSWGGYKFLLARRVFMPLVLTAVSLYLTHSWWSLTMMLAYGSMTLGYGDNSPVRHVFGDAWGRGVWSLLAGLCLSTAMFVTGHLSIYFYVPYLIACFFVEPLMKNLWQVVGDFIIGAVLASFILAIHPS